MANVFLISYDLRAPGRDYGEFCKALQELPATNVHVLESVWVVFLHNGSSAEGIRALLAEHMDENDGLLVVPIDRSQVAAQHLIHPV